MDLDRGSIDRSSMDRSDGVYYLRATIAGIGDIYANLFVPAYLRAQIDGSGDISAGLVVGVILHAQIDGSGDIWAWLSGGNTVTRTITFAGTLAVGESVVIDGLTFSILNDGDNVIGGFAGDFPMIFPSVNLLKYTDGVASRIVHITVVQPGAPVTAEMAESLTLTYSGTLAAGKTLVIDGSNLTVENDGTNDMAYFAGDFPRIFPGTNTFTYTDSAGSRTVKIAVIREERGA